MIGALREIDAAIPADVEQELAIQRRIADGLNVQQAASAAAAKLGSVDAKHFDQAVDDALDALARHQARAALQPALEQAAANRLSSAVAVATPAWIEATVAAFNSTVDSAALNQHGPNLPDIAAKGFSAINITAPQGAALDAFRTSGATLGKLWSLLVRLAKLEGVELGAGRELSDNLNTVFVLSPMSWKTALRAADELAVFASGADSVKPWQSLSPWVIPALIGSRLELCTLDQAAKRRQAAQRPSGAAVA